MDNSRRPGCAGPLKASLVKAALSPGVTLRTHADPMLRVSGWAGTGGNLWSGLAKPKTLGP
eukprot:4962168-Amphidinium_carterae.1